MRIPSGDLAPARKRGGRSSYVRRRPRWPVAVAGLALLGIAGGAYALRSQDASAPARLAQAVVAPSCAPTPAATAARPAARPLPAPATVSFHLLNGTTRSGLGRSVGDALAARGLIAKDFGNASGPLAGDSKIGFGAGAEPGAQLLAANVLGAQVVGDPKALAGTVTVTLGATFVRLRTDPELAAYLAALVATPTPAPSSARACR